MNINKYRLLVAFMALALLMQLNTAAFYELIQCDLYTTQCSTHCQSSHMHHPYKGVCDTLFKIWNALDLMQSLQCSIPEGEGPHYGLLADAVTVFYELKTYTHAEWKSHPDDFNAMHRLLQHIEHHEVTNHTSSFKKMIHLCCQTAHEFDQHKGSIRSL